MYLFSCIFASNNNGIVAWYHANSLSYESKIKAQTESASFFSVFFSQEESLMRRSLTRSLPLQLQSRSTLPVLPPVLLFSLASLGTWFTSLCQQTGAQKAGGTKYFCVPPPHGVSTCTQKLGSIPQTFHLNTPSVNLNESPFSLCCSWKGYTGTALLQWPN